MMIRLRFTLLSAALALCCLSVHAQQTDGLQQRMSAEEFKAAGLDKLSPQELQNLDGWLSAHAKVKVTTRVVTESGKPVFYPEQGKRGKIYAHLVGHFGGWSVGRELTLDNGQVWKQVGSDSPSCLTSDNPSVKIKPSLMGTWLMFVNGCNDDAHVERVK
ncbi:hypothetical protein HDE76_002177 [Rhodanobacter sp. ANJX3]|uniref:hypothetical protein n=1 Tax=Rhodanobacter sp. ANJX3 TaxID=2723083 RepID=UPI00161B90EE|nr:hypothetical protein [Rhodanobacter sp. ANJX3]MBB5358961.1 hypothetical protein [Rhodanobacter sp. ANJX3]